MPRVLTGRAQHVTLCTVCGREIGVAQSWNRWQSGQSAEWRVTRHGVTEQKRGVKSAICAGTGIQVEPGKVLA